MSVVVKVGGSLYDLDDLGPRLRKFLEESRPPILVVAGGGAIADAIRQFDRVHRLGDEVSHWLALRACSVGASFVAELLGGVPVSADASFASPLRVVDLFAFAQADERNADRWPHRWDVTTDSMAVRVAGAAGARELILLKSIDIAEDDWSAAAARGDVDPFFPEALARTPGLRVRAVNFRRFARP